METSSISKTFFLLPELGNHRGNENPFLLSLGIMWFRYHNRMADKIKTQHPEWNDEKIFNEARKWVIATYQVEITSLSYKDTYVFSSIE